MLYVKPFKQIVCNFKDDLLLLIQLPQLWILANYTWKV
jgi:hypothetical protein